METSSAVVHLCRIILGPEDQSEACRNDPIPEGLRGVYAKLTAANDLGKHTRVALAEAALVREALTNGEDDRVRIECVQQLFRMRSRVVEFVLLALLFDSDEELRLTAVEGLVLLQSQHLELAATILSNDDCDEVRSAIRSALSGEDMLLYRLNPR